MGFTLYLGCREISSNELVSRILWKGIVPDWVYIWGWLSIWGANFSLIWFEAGNLHPSWILPTSPWDYLECLFAPDISNARFDLFSRSLMKQWVGLFVTHLEVHISRSAWIHFLRHSCIGRGHLMGRGLSCVAQIIYRYTSPFLLNHHVDVWGNWRHASFDVEAVFVEPHLISEYRRFLYLCFSSIFSWWIEPCKSYPFLWNCIVQIGFYGVHSLFGAQRNQLKWSCEE